MRILQIRFKNLNSLVGEWSIDLNHPAFTSDGIFAITGPTGAGKTTILDALCLALYGRTPRLSKITKNSNEIISRQTGECFAEVTFESQAGRYRCHWSQRRARKKPDGELQVPKHEIANADSGEIFEAKLRGVAEQIEIATGMDFDRFTRSMLLAQGGFANFLQAIPDDRAPILEQITGTGIYSDISIRVHEQYGIQRKKLDLLSEKLEGIQLLSAEDVQFLEAELQKEIDLEQTLRKRLEKIQQAADWLEALTRLGTEVAVAERHKVDLHERLQAFAPEQARLQQASLALELTGDYVALHSERIEQEKSKEKLCEAEQGLPRCEQVLEQAELVVTHAAGRLEMHLQKQAELAPLIRQARALDYQLAEKNRVITEAALKFAERQRYYQSLLSAYHANQTHLQTRQKLQEVAVSKLTNHQADERLLEHFAGLKQAIAAVQKEHQQLLDKLDAAQKAKANVDSHQVLWLEKKDYLAEVKQFNSGLREEILLQQEKQGALLKGETFPQVRQRYTALLDRQTGLIQADKWLADCSAIQLACAESQTRHSALMDKHADLNKQLEAELSQYDSLEETVSLLENQVSLLDRIIALEDARHQLQDGQPCPLCGAEEHPYAQGNMPSLDKSREQLNSARIRLKALEQNISSLRVDQARTAQELEQVTARRGELKVQLQGASAELEKLSAILGLAVTPRESGAIDAALQETTAELTQASTLITEAENGEHHLQSLRDSLERADAKLRDAERAAQDAQHKLESASLEAQRLKEEGAALQNQQERALFYLQKELAGYGVEAPSIEKLTGITRTLQQRREQWLGWQQEKLSAEQQCAVLEVKLRFQKDEIEKLETELAESSLDCARLEQGRNELSTSRQQILADKCPDKAELEVGGAVDNARRDLELGQENLAQARQAYSQLRSRVEELTLSVAKRSEQLFKWEAAFSTRLSELGFESEQAYTAACLPAEQRRLLEQQARALDAERIEWDTKLQGLHQALHTKVSQKMTSQSPSELEAAKSELLAKQTSLQQSIASARHKLQENSRLQMDLQAQLRAIELQSKECARWRLLHELIGSSDGKKYRNFAQGLTFKIMIGHANLQLKKMTDRYLLIRDQSRPLELNVLDSYQGGEVRSTKNLSGGESFIVSLALALGLSQMTSHNVRVDSLFLDEGFGTLDEDALDMALETLAGLQQEGKLIGVISHVPALKERIATQIAVQPQAGGRSVLVGEGCRRH